MIFPVYSLALLLHPPQNPLKPFAGSGSALHTCRREQLKVTCTVGTCPKGVGAIANIGRGGGVQSPPVPKGIHA